MFKKFLLTIGFISIFLFQAPTITPKVFAASENSAKSIFEVIWESILSLFGQLTPIKTDVARQKKVSSQNTDIFKFTDYTDLEMDFSQRTFPELIRKKLIGIWFSEVIIRPALFSQKKAYTNEIITEANNNCPEIKITDIIYYFYSQTNQKILYDRSSSPDPIDYPGDVDQYAIDLGPGSCYENAYEHIQSVPYGVFEDKGDATFSSTQLNQQLRYIIPQNVQGEDAPNDNDTAEKTKELVTDSDKQHLTMRRMIIPQDIQDQVDCIGDDDKMVKTFKHVLQPQEWQGKIKNNTDNTNNCATNNQSTQITEQNETPSTNEVVSEETYIDILASYYDVQPNEINLKNINSTNSKTTIKLINNSSINECDEIINQYPDRFKFGNQENSYRTFILTVEDYLLGLDDSNIDWSLETYKAQTIIARTNIYNQTNNFTQSINDTMNLSSGNNQVFSCTTLLANLDLINNQINDNQVSAVQLTTGLIL